MGSRKDAAGKKVRRERMVTSQVSSESLGQAAKCGFLASHRKEFKSKP